jgi:hypothetical protein
MEEHVKVVAILNIVLGGLGVLAALFVLLFFGGLAGLAGSDPSPDSDVGATILGLIGGVGFLVLAVLSLPCVIAGYGLLHYRPWAQTLTIVMSILNLIHIPLGTALGIYSLWVLFNEETKSLFRAKAAA